MKKSVGSMGILYSKGAVLCFRERDRDGLPKGGYRLFHAPSARFSALRKAIASTCEGEVRLFHDEGEFPLSPGEKARVYLLKEGTPLSFPKGRDVRFVKEGDLPSLHLMPSTRFVLTRFFALAPLYLGLLWEAREEGEEKAALFLARSLKYFEKKGTFPKEERARFDVMFLANAPLASLRKAHRYFLDAYGLDLNEYLERVRIKRRSRELS